MNKYVKYTLWTLLGFVLYTATAIPLGLIFYETKKAYGWDIFTHTGMSHFKACLRYEAKAALTGERDSPKY